MRSASPCPAAPSWLSASSASGFRPAASRSSAWATRVSCTAIARAMPAAGREGERGDGRRAICPADVPLGGGLRGDRAHVDVLPPAWGRALAHLPRLRRLRDGVPMGVLADWRRPAEVARANASFDRRKGRFRGPGAVAVRAEQDRSGDRGLCGDRHLARRGILAGLAANRLTPLASPRHARACLYA